ncbi:Undecaprenyl-phosphate galactose phosphotransferase WbaP/exopolysaccharide biosynthesis polyprenyl glycosylphosphotransferase [Motilibacter peucedani]|uniref:Undecaprenyl-phosphate galactose phosphotransferase WbaP/exopolysaccharide biosynthesis polyprenyl glycosylphosphotransferase n=1 Tax=Motilibacter peucedani TaxID=598650 RepID=A0A420XTA1_9ACTN|nr:sugar transferase [Motilibacter peucedani]RKS79990.1 Undecaprenyl-phosphate galactose phosphotransferase WbaP/exopolysaccharide biosynthesis polyprenyl glycosylphosphotransferase [Motilibacter peucedani]
MLEVEREVSLAAPSRRPPRRPAAVAAAGRAPWMRRLESTLWACDLVVILLAVTASVAVRWNVSGEALSRSASPERDTAYLALAVVLAMTWMTTLSLHMSRDRRIAGSGPEEYKRVVTATVRLFGVFAILAFLGRADFARPFVAVAFPVGAVGLVLERWVARKWLHWHRRRGGWAHRVLVVGSRDNVAHLTAELAREAYAGFEVVGVCVPGGAYDEVDDGLHVVGSLTTIPEAVVATGVDTVAVTPSVGLTPAALRRLGWALEGTGVDLVVAPALTDVAGPRVHVRPVAGLPLLHVEPPQYEGPMRVAKGVFDRVVALALVLVLSPLIVGIALAVRLTSAGPVLFRQVRVGRDGRSFTLYKFRSMVADAEHMVSRLAQLNEHDGVLFKIRADPRVTPVGRVIRRYSLDELPQLLNVLRGEMSLVGPRPPLPSEVANYAFDARRRLLVKPGMTGLWQVSGRSDLSWEDTVRLDLYYVENWSMTADMLILWKTLAAVVRGSGAY